MGAPGAEEGSHPTPATLATSTYYAAKKRGPSARAVRDAELKTLISRVHADNFRARPATRPRA
ncbi:MAG: hypothetical protein LBV60_15090 [Streptomyces sp.]|jgi:hypothetical protein|nr:hypothetical protein [Streptomyces sp.]